MLYIDSPYKAGTIAIARGELARYTDFDDSLDKVLVPRGTEIVRLKGPSVSRNRNKIVSEFFKTGDWLCFVDDDQVLPPDTILKLLSHHKPIVGALYSTKMPPYFPTAFKERLADGKYRHWSWRDLATGGRLRKCASTGTGCMVIQREVFKKIPEPWFVAMEFTDDVHFCQRALEHGYEIYVDTEAIIGHTSTHNVWPDLSVPGVRLEHMWLHLQITDDDGEDASSAHEEQGSERDG